jgi:hypothetical protein
MTPPRNGVDEEKSQESGNNEGIVMVEVNREPVKPCLGSIHGLENGPIQIDRQGINDDANEN